VSQVRRAPGDGVAAEHDARTGAQTRLSWAVVRFVQVTDRTKASAFTPGVEAAMDARHVGPGICSAPWPVRRVLDVARKMPTVTRSPARQGVPSRPGPGAGRNACGQRCQTQPAAARDGSLRRQSTSQCSLEAQQQLALIAPLPEPAGAPWGEGAWA